MADKLAWQNGAKHKSKCKFFTVFVFLLSIVFQMSSFPDYRALIEEGYAPIWPRTSDKNFQNLSVRVQVICSAAPDITTHVFELN